MTWQVNNKIEGKKVKAKTGVKARVLVFTIKKRPIERTDSWSAGLDFLHQPHFPDLHLNCFIPVVTQRTGHLSVKPQNIFCSFTKQSKTTSVTKLVMMLKQC